MSTSATKTVAVEPALRLWPRLCVSVLCKLYCALLGAQVQVKLVIVFLPRPMHGMRVCNCLSCIEYWRLSFFHVLHFAFNGMVDTQAATPNTYTGPHLKPHEKCEEKGKGSNFFTKLKTQLKTHSTHNEGGSCGVCCA